MVIPAFDTVGNIPVGEYEPSLSEFKERFVNKFDKSKTRGILYKNYIKYNQSLSTLGVAENEWVPGSFTSEKTDPEDIDILVYIDGFLLVRKSKEYDFWTYFDPEMIYKYYSCHTHIVFKYPEGDPRDEHARHKREYFENLFQKDWSGRPRGIVKFDLLAEQYISDLKAEAEA